MNIVIIGNGFDLHHSLNTSYKDFKNYLKLNHTNFIQLVEKYIVKEVDENFNNIDIWSNLEESLSRVDYERIHDDMSTFLKPYSSEDWSDSYHHDYQYEIDKALSFSKNLTKYLKDWILELKIEVKKEKLINFITPEKQYISFNYTDTLEEIYKIPEKKILYIHGKAKRDQNIIFGHNSEYLSPFYNFHLDDIRMIESEEICKNCHNRLKKPSNEIININKKFFENLTNIKNVYILGHSLSKIDDIYYRTLIKFIPKNCKWHISWHNEEDNKNIDKFIERNNISGEVHKIQLTTL